MTIKELKEAGVKVYLSPHSFHWVKELPHGRLLAKNITPFRKLDTVSNEYKPRIGEVYFEESTRIAGFWLSSIKEYTDFEKLSDYILNKLIYY